MSDHKAQRQAMDRAPETGGKAYTRSSVTTAERLEIPSEMQGIYCEFSCRGVDWIAIRFGGSSVTVDASTDSSVSSETLSAGGSEPHIVVFRDSTEPVRIDSSKWSHMSHIASGTGGKLHFGAKSGDGN